MKNKILSLFLVLTLCFINLSFADENTNQKIDEILKSKNIEQGDVLNIGEKMFLTQIYDIYFNYEGYDGKVISLEGMYDIVGNITGEKDDIRPMIYRRSPGCCGNDGFDGFLLQYDGAFPQNNDWIKLYGKLHKGLDTDPIPGVYLEVIAYEVMDIRGQEFVEQ